MRNGRSSRLLRRCLRLSDERAPPASPVAGPQRPAYPAVQQPCCFSCTRLSIPADPPAALTTSPPVHLSFARRGIFLSWFGLPRFWRCTPRMAWVHSRATWRASLWPETPGCVRPQGQQHGGIRGPTAGTSSASTVQGRSLSVLCYAAVCALTCRCAAVCTAALLPLHRRTSCWYRAQSQSVEVCRVADSSANVCGPKATSISV